MAQTYDSVGFTGTRQGMTWQQGSSLAAMLWLMKPKEVHHGDCVGADEQFHKLAQTMRIQRIIIHPPDNPVLRANCAGGFMLATKPYLVRNEDIVVASDIMIAAPKGEEVFSGSGTWQTIRRAYHLKKDILVIFPDGHVERRTR